MGVVPGVPATKVRKQIQTVAFLGPAAALAVLASVKNMSTVAAVSCMTVALAFKSLGKYLNSSSHVPGTVPAVLHPQPPALPRTRAC